MEERKLSQKIMAINSGSSSLKFQLYEMPEETLVVKGLFERINSSEGMIFSYTINQKKCEKKLKETTHGEAVQILLTFLMTETLVTNLDEIKGVGHRIAHGGEYFKTSTVIKEKEKREIQELSHLAPLHNPVNLIGIEAFQKVLPNCPQIGVFDTSFHQTLPKYQYIYPIPFNFYQKDKIRKYGFHGTSHQYVSQKAADLLSKDIHQLNIITCHLGNGASICGIKNGKSMMTSMGFTPLAGLMMGTRSGDIDPSIVTYLQTEKDYTPNQVNDLLNHQSGLLGIYEKSNDLRDIIKATEENDEQAILALEMFTSRVKQTIASYAAEMGGVNVVIFTAGIGENSALIREKSCNGLECLGLQLNPELNEKHQTIISDLESDVQVLVIPTNEELMIVKETLNLIR